MMVISLKDYAKQNNISYEAVRQQVVRYKKDLEGHLIKDGRQQFLDEEAVAFLDAKRQKNPVAIIQQDKDETIENLERENKNLLIKIAAVQEELLQEKDKNYALEIENKKIKLLEDKNGEISAERDELKGKIAEAEKTAEEANTELIEAQKRIAELEGRKWYHLLFKKGV